MGYLFNDNLTIILRQCRTYNRLTIDVQFTKHLTNGAVLFLGTIHSQNRKIVGDSVRILTYDIPKRNLSKSQFAVESGLKEFLIIVHVGSQLRRRGIVGAVRTHR